MKKVLLILLGLFFHQDIFGQDTLYTEDNRKLEVKIVENTGDKVKYILPGYKDNPPVVAMDAHRVEKIGYQNGYVDLMGSQNPRKKRPIGVNLVAQNLGTEGRNTLTISGDYFVIPQLELEARMGSGSFESSFYMAMGGKYHFNYNYSENNITPFTGIMIGSDPGDTMLQLPIGVNYLTDFGVNAAFSVKKLLFFDEREDTAIEIKLGYKFEM